MEDPNKEPKINLFNEDINDWGKKDNKEEKQDKHCRHCRRGGLSIWGLILLFVGTCLLLNNMGLVSRDIWLLIIPFWPIILILIGIKIILGGSKVAGWISFILALVLLSVIFFNALLQLDGRYFPGVYPPIMGHFNSFYIINR